MAEQFPKMTLQEIYEELVRRSRRITRREPSSYDAGHENGEAAAYRAAADMLMSAYILPRAK